MKPSVKVQMSEDQKRTQVNTGKPALPVLIPLGGDASRTKPQQPFASTRPSAMPSFISTIQLELRMLRQSWQIGQYRGVVTLVRIGVFFQSDADRAISIDRTHPNQQGGDNR